MSLESNGNSDSLASKLLEICWCTIFSSKTDNYYINILYYNDRHTVKWCSTYQPSSIWCRGVVIKIVETVFLRTGASNVLLWFKPNLQALWPLWQVVFTYITCLSHWYSHSPSSVSACWIFVPHAWERCRLWQRRHPFQLDQAELAA